MGKLVRDNIPEIFRASGRRAHFTVLTEGQYADALRDKLREEVDELLAADPDDILEETADILEVLTAIVEVQGASLDAIVAVAGSKRAERGGFSRRLWLQGVEPNPPGEDQPSGSHRK